ncbi:MAG: archease [Candidatus Latescibacteria bacterium]|nr:archease [Candidatus Latescibacterota bacterium]
MPYVFLDDIAIADVAFEAWGDTLEALFVSAAEATVNVMVEDLDSIGERVDRVVRVESEARDLLLFNFLQEFIFFKDAQQLLLRPSEIEISRTGGGFAVDARLVGETLDPERHSLVVDVKAVTLHRFKVEETERGWEAFVILDI